MVKNVEQLERIFRMVKLLKKSIVAVHPNGTILGTDEQYATVSELIPFNEEDIVNVQFPYIFTMTGLNSFMKLVAGCKDGTIVYTPSGIQIVMGNGYTQMLPIYFSVDSMDYLYSRYAFSKQMPILKEIEDFQGEMLQMKLSDGARMFNIDNFLMTSFNAIHPVTKSDKVDVIIRDYDEFSYTGEFVINKKKQNCVIHELFRFRKL